MSFLNTPWAEKVKFVVATVGAVATALLGVFTADTDIGKVLTIVAAVATAVGVYWAKNAPAVEPAPSGGVPAEDDMGAH